MTYDTHSHICMTVTCRIRQSQPCVATGYRKWVTKEVRISGLSRLRSWNISKTKEVAICRLFSGRNMCWPNKQTEVPQMSNNSERTRAQYARYLSLVPTQRVAGDQSGGQITLLHATARCGNSPQITVRLSSRDLKIGSKTTSRTPIGIPSSPEQMPMNIVPYRAVKNLLFIR